MQPIRGVRDILPNEIILWQYIYDLANEVFTLSNYQEIRTPILENTELFKRSIGNYTDIVNKEMYNFIDQGNRDITLRPEGTSSIVRAFISNKLYLQQRIHKLWYLGPMFRYERPQKGRQRQFHQLGIECIGSQNPIADVEVIRLAIQLLKSLKLNHYILEINSIGNFQERSQYKSKLKDYLNKYKNDLDKDSQNRLNNNTLRILDSKNIKTQEILKKAPKLTHFLQIESIEHFNEICNHLDYIDIQYTINDKLVRGLDYYNYTAFEIKTKESNNQNTICGGGRYDQLIQQLGGPNTPSVGWAIGIERLILLVKDILQINNNNIIIYIAIQDIQISYKVWDIVKIIEKYKINFEIDLSINHLNKQLKKANQLCAKICFILGKKEIINNYITVKWLETRIQQEISINHLPKYLQYLKTHFKT
uniref:Histidine--tRNA ligase, chloroplastic n=1 Tax=Sonderella linearis TaxID=110477 RepID=A0A1Z1MM62_9FLOR|nr:Histidine-tRNA ligase [Sonderella linearis]ARW67128.1 Histidine-tRNA ligase [Sonderella linearis]